MGTEKWPDERYEPRAGDLEGEPDEVFKVPAELQKGRIEISKKEPTKDEPRKKTRWWHRLWPVGARGQGGEHG